MRGLVFETEKEIELKISSRLVRTWIKTLVDLILVFFSLVPSLYFSFPPFSSPTMVNITRARSSVKIKFVLIRREIKHELKTIAFVS